MLYSSVGRDACGAATTRPCNATLHSASKPSLSQSGCRATERSGATQHSTGTASSTKAGQRLVGDGGDEMGPNPAAARITSAVHIATNAHQTHTAVLCTATLHAANER